MNRHALGAGLDMSQADRRIHGESSLRDTLTSGYLPSLLLLLDLDVDFGLSS